VHCLQSGILIMIGKREHKVLLLGFAGFLNARKGTLPGTVWNRSTIEERAVVVNARPNWIPQPGWASAG